MNAETQEQRRARLEAELAQLDGEQKTKPDAAVSMRPSLDDQRMESLKEIAEKAHDALDREFPESWQPQKPELNHPAELAGIILRIDLRVGPSRAFGTYASVIELKDTTTTEWTIWCPEGGALHGQLWRLRLEVGELIGVRYQGMKRSENDPNRSYHAYRLVRLDDERDGPAELDYDAPPPVAVAAITPAAPAEDDSIPF